MLMINKFLNARLLRVPITSGIKAPLLSLKSPLLCRYSTAGDGSKEPKKEKTFTISSMSSNQKLEGKAYYLSFFLVALTGGYLLYSYKRKKEHFFEKINETLATKSHGAGDVGGPFKLIDENGIERTDADFNGFFKLIYFGFTHCPDICPDELDKMGEVLELVNKDPETSRMVYPLFISVDAKRDTPDVVKEYLTDFHPMILGLSGNEAETLRVAKNYRVYFSPAKLGPKDIPSGDYLVDHTIYLYFMDPSGNFIDVFGKDTTSEQVYQYIKECISDYGTNSKDVVIKRVEEFKQIPKPIPTQ